MGERTGRTGRTDWRAVWEAKGDVDGATPREYDGFERTDVDPARVAGAITDALALTGDDVVVEVGCGAGMVTRELPGTTVGLDYSASLLRRHRGFGRRPLAQAEAVSLPLRDGGCDCAVAYSVFQYFPSEAYARACLDEMVRVARRAVFVGDLPLVSHDPDHLLFRPEQFPGWTVLPACYDAPRFNLALTLSANPVLGTGFRAGTRNPVPRTGGGGGEGPRAVLRERWDGQVWTELPVQVAFRSPELVGLYVRPGAVFRRPVTRDGTPLRLPDQAWSLRPERWRTETLRLHLPDVPCSVQAQWTTEGTARRFAGWYLSVEDPLRPGDDGSFETLDRIVDVVVAPDRRSWRWKDVDEMARARSLGLSGMVPPRDWLIAATEVLALLRDRRGPFDADWETWTPGPELAPGVGVGVGEGR